MYVNFFSSPGVGTGRVNNRNANRSNEVRHDVRAPGFWERGQQALYDLRVFDLNTCRYLNKSPQ